MRLLIASWMICLLAACTQVDETQSTAPALAGDRDRAPNIVILFADDLGYGDLGSYGHPYTRTPNLDELARTGQRWTDFYVAAPVCSPSRGALLTGRLPNRTGLYGRRVAVLFPNDTVGIPESEITLAEALKDRGYATGIVGKWHLGDAPEAYPTRHGFDFWYGVPYSNDMDWVGEKTIDELLAMSARGETEALGAEIAQRNQKYFDPRNEYWNVPVIRSVRTEQGFDDRLVERPAQQHKLTRQQTEEAVRFIQRNQDQPFFLYVPYSMPHTPIFRSERFEDRSLSGRYGDVIEELDWSVGQIVQALGDADIAEDTLVVFTSDNGPWLIMNQHGGTAGLLRNGKGTTFEGGVRVPAIFSWPGRIEPGVVSGLGSAMDLHATALALAGVESPVELDGINLSATLFDGAESPRATLAYYRQGELYAYRKGPFKLHLVTSGVYGQPPPRVVHERPLLYHLPSDPAERFDVADEFPEIVEDILATISEHQAGLADQQPLFDQRLKRVQR